MNCSWSSRIVMLALCFLWMTCSPLVSRADAAAQLNPEFLERQVKLFDVGSEIKVKLADGKKLEGLIADIGTQNSDPRIRRMRRLFL
jgi:hypothetical protein